MEENAAGLHHHINFMYKKKRILWHLFIIIIIILFSVKGISI